MNNKAFIFKNNNNNKFILVKQFDNEIHLFKLENTNFNNAKDDAIMINDEFYTIKTTKEYIVKQEWFQWYIINNPDIICVDELVFDFDHSKTEIIIECDEFIDSTFVF